MNKNIFFKQPKIKFIPLRWLIFFVQTIGRISYMPIYLSLKYTYLLVAKISLQLNKQENILKNIVFLPKKIIFKLKIHFLKIFRKTYNLIFHKLNKISFKISFEKLFYQISKSLYLFFNNLKNKCHKFSFIKIRFVFPGKDILKFFLVTSTIMIFAAGIYFYETIIKDLPNPNKLLQNQPNLTTKIYARDGSLLYKIYRNQNRSLVDLDKLPRYVIDATVAVEDKNYWNHPGFSVEGITRALKKNFENGDETEGGSTITQQLVKNALLSPEKTYIRKLKELILAIQVELMFSKHDILEMYFNQIPYGGTAYGIEEAAQTYFGKSAYDLNLAEASLLAGLPSAPTKYSPFGSNPQFAIYRQRHVLNRMLEEKYIDTQTYDQALNTKVYLKSPYAKIKAPHFVMYVKDLLVKKYGTRMVESGGLEVYTSLDPKIQDIAQKSVTDEVNKLIPMNVTNGAALVTNPQNGEILAMVGSRDYFDTEHDGNVNVTTQLRQPGSSIKPVTYALALTSGMTPYSTIVDEPVSYPDGPNRWYTPVNYDGRFHGVVNLKTALASSFNIPAVKLADKLGVDQILNFAKSLGITTWNDRSRFGLSITLGGGEVKMTDMAVVYSVFANEGYKIPLHAILEIKNAKGEVLQNLKCQPDLNFLPEAEAYDSNQTCKPQKVLSEEVAYQITQMLSDDYARSPAFGFNSLLNIPDAAVKTGTTNDKRDNWAIGYDKTHTVVVWVGNNNNTPMSAVASGITGATPIWHNIISSIKAEKDDGLPTPPKTMLPVQICATNGLLPCGSCPVVKTEYFPLGKEPRLHCVDKPKDENKDKPEENKI